MADRTGDADSYRPQRVQHRGNVAKQSTAWPRTPCTSASARSNIPPHYSRPPVVERQQSMEPSALSAIAWISGLVRRLWAGLVLNGLTRQSSSRACWRNPRRRRIWRVQSATNGGGGWGRATGATSHTSPPFASERFNPRAPAPVAPPLPAQPAIRRSTRRENGPSLRRSPPPATAGQH